jgi:sulfite oxidase
MTVSGKDPNLLVHTQSPFNAGPRLHDLRQQFITPLPFFYVRSHGNVPQIDSDQYRLSITGLIQKPTRLSLPDIRSLFPKHQITATLQCAGNRRHELSAIAPTLGGVPWGAEAIGNAQWAGARLKDVLEGVGVESSACHAAFTGMDDIERHPGGFGGSIPIEKALTPDVLLAYEMNGQPLPPEHGFPLRVIAPGYIGARSVKWLSEISLQTEPSLNYYQAQTYKLYPPHITANTAHTTTGLSIGELSVNAAICKPHNGATLTAGSVNIQGYAVTSGGRYIARVDLSTDGGHNWATTKLTDNSGTWSWRFWECELNLPSGSHELVVRAWDSAANTQPEAIAHIWNFQGYMNNAWHRIKVRCE